MTTDALMMLVCFIFMVERYQGVAGDEGAGVAGTGAEPGSDEEPLEPAAGAGAGTAGAEVEPVVPFGSGVAETVGVVPDGMLGVEAAVEEGPPGDELAEGTAGVDVAVTVGAV